MTGYFATDAASSSGAASFDSCNQSGMKPGCQAEEAGFAQVLDEASDDGQTSGIDQEIKQLQKDIDDMNKRLNALLEKKEGQDGKPSSGVGDHQPHEHGGSDKDQVQKGTSGEDVYHGDDSHDHADGGHGNDKMRGGKGHDNLSGGHGDDQIHGDKGHDRLRGNEGQDEIRGGDGHDRINGGRDDDRLYGGDGHDKILGGEGDDRLYGGKGNDRLVGGEGDNRMKGGAGDDTYVIESGSENVIKDGKGMDTVKFDGDRSDYKMERDGDDLVITSKKDDTKVVIKDQYDGDGGVDTLRFDDSKVNADLAGLKFGVIRAFAE